VTTGVKYDVPPGPFGGSEAYVSRPMEKNSPTREGIRARGRLVHDLNVYTVPVSGGAPSVITAGNRGADQNPVYAPDGRTIFMPPARAGFESDGSGLMAYDRSTRTSRRAAPELGQETPTPMPSRRVATRFT